MGRTHLYVVPFMVVAALAEEAVGDDFMDIELVQHGVGVLNASQVNTERVKAETIRGEPCSRTR